MITPEDIQREYENGDSDAALKAIQKINGGGNVFSGMLDPKNADQNPLFRLAERAEEKRRMMYTDYTNRVKQAMIRRYPSDLGNSFTASARHPIMEKLAKAWGGIKAALPTLENNKNADVQVEQDAPRHDDI